MRARKGVRTITVDGVTDTIAGWARRSGITVGTIHTRLHNGWSKADAVGPRRMRWRQRGKSRPDGDD
jgi:hypothetical protein